MFRDNKPSRLRTVAGATVLGIAGFAIAGCGGAAAEGRTTNCYSATIEDTSGVIGAMRTALHDEAHVDISGLSGFQDTANKIDQKLLAEHKQHTWVMPGDEFSVCLTGDDLTAGSQVEVVGN